MAETSVKIEGMSCQHCVMRVKKAVDALNGVTQSEVAVGNAVVKFDESVLQGSDIVATIEKAGYKVVR